MEIIVTRRDFIKAAELADGTAFIAGVLPQEAKAVSGAMARRLFTTARILNPTSLVHHYFTNFFKECL